MMDKLNQVQIIVDDDVMEGLILYFDTDENMENSPVHVCEKLLSFFPNGTKANLNINHEIAWKGEIKYLDSENFIIHGQYE